MAKRFAKNSGPSQRQLRAGELIRHALVEIFAREELRDPALAGVSLTVSEVRAAPDLKQATVFCAPLGVTLEGGVSAHQPMIDALNKAGPQLRYLLGKRVDLKFTPALKFRLDESFDEAGRVDELLASPSVSRDLQRGS
ncbi:MAG: 30S ribosome-binding factor RbfA [Pseudomonadota bacterium]